MVKVFVDTNVLVDFFAPERDYYMSAAELLTLILNNTVEAALTTQSILDTAYICRKYPSFSIDFFKERIQHLLVRTNVTYIDTFQLGDALEDPHPDIEDNAQICCAYSEGCDVFLTNDKGVLSRKMPSPMQVMTPAAFLARCRA